MPRLTFSVPPPPLAHQPGVHLVVHLAWETRDGRGAALSTDDGALEAILRGAARALACDVVAAAHEAREVHVLVRHPATVRVSELVERLKEVSARAWRGPRRALVWAPGYVACSCDPSQAEGRAAQIARLGLELRQRAAVVEPAAAVS